MNVEQPLKLEQHREQLQLYFTGQADVLLAYPFVSTIQQQAEAPAAPGIAILLDDATFRGSLSERRVRIIDDLRRMMPDNQIELVLLNDDHLVFNYQVLCDGALLYCRSVQRRILFQADTVSRYLDYKPFIERFIRGRAG
jgi:hypothetical protein